jgi:protein-S-isoprenylcysteine O-methyltransferase Ste14
VLRMRIRRFMAALIVIALLMLCVRVLVERGTDSETVGRKMLVGFLLFYAIVVVACFAIAYIRGAPEERTKLFASPPEYQQFRFKTNEQWASVIAIVRKRIRMK